MRDKTIQSSIPWKLTLLLSSLCYFGIAGVLKFFTQNLPTVFFWIGIANFALGCISCLATIITKEIHRKQHFTV